MGDPEDVNKPCAQVTLNCIGKLGVEENKKHSEKLTPIICKLLGVPDDRFYITFNDLRRPDGIQWDDIRISL